MTDLHPAPAELDRTWPNRDQTNTPSELHVMWRRAVEDLAAQLQADPIYVHYMLRDAANTVLDHTAWNWWE